MDKGGHETGEPPLEDAQFAGAEFPGRRVRAGRSRAGSYMLLLLTVLVVFGGYLWAAGAVIGSLVVFAVAAVIGFFTFLTVRDQIRRQNDYDDWR